MNLTIRIPFLTKMLLATALLSIALLSGGGVSKAADTSAASTQSIDLPTQYTIPFSTLTNYVGFPAWKGCVFGHQVFHGVPFQINGVTHLWGAGPNPSHPGGYPECISNIVVNRTFPTLYLCHGSYYKTLDGTPVLKVVLRYDDDSSMTNTLCFGNDILDWKVSPNESPLRTPSSNNSMLAWMGGEFSPKEKTPLRYCLTALDNPHPDRAVATIDLISCKARTVPFILGMTTGPSGLTK